VILRAGRRAREIAAVGGRKSSRLLTVMGASIRSSNRAFGFTRVMLGEIATDLLSYCSSQKNACISRLGDAADRHRVLWKSATISQYHSRPVSFTFGLWTVFRNSG
jgi:hypothetical protein